MPSYDRIRISNLEQRLAADSDGDGHSRPAELELLADLYIQADESKTVQYFHHSSRVGVCRPYPKINVRRESWMSVPGNSERTHHQLFNFDQVE